MIDYRTRAAILGEIALLRMNTGRGNMERANYNIVRALELILEALTAPASDATPPTMKSALEASRDILTPVAEVTAENVWDILTPVVDPATHHVETAKVVTVEDIWTKQQTIETDAVAGLAKMGIDAEITTEVLEALAEIDEVMKAEQLADEQEKAAPAPKKRTRKKG